LVGAVAPLTTTVVVSDFSPLDTVAESAFPVNAPVNPVDDTDTNPAIVVAEAPNATDVEPIVTALFVRPPLGIPVKLVPVDVGVVENAGIAEADPTNTPAAPAVIAGTPVAPVVATP